MTQQDFKRGIGEIDNESGRTNIYVNPYAMPTCCKGISGIWDAIGTGIQSASSILSARYSVPQLNAGQYIQTPQGVMYQLGPGQSNSLFPGSSTFSQPGSGISPLMIGGLALVALLALKR